MYYSTGVVVPSSETCEPARLRVLALLRARLFTFFGLLSHSAIFVRPHHFERIEEKLERCRQQI